MSDVNQTEKPEPAVHMAKSDFLSLLLLGAGFGLVVWGLSYLLDQYIFSFFCSSQNAGLCTNATNYSLITSTFLAAIAALAGLIKLRVYRPLLVVIASVLSTWGIVQLAAELPLFTGILVVSVLYGLAFGAFGWLARLRQFLISLIAIVLLIVVVRVIMNS